jgi:hypothetical protein
MKRDRRQEISGLVGELAELARTAPARIGDRVASLDIREQAELALRLPARDRSTLLLHAPRPMRLVRSLPDFEFYATVREVGPADALPLVALGSAAQLQHLLDLESWRGDRFDAKRAGAWVALVLESGEPALRRFLRSADDDQLALLFQRWLRPEPIVPEVDHEKHGHGFTETGDERGLVTPDGYYRLSPVIREHVPAAARIVRMLFTEQSQRYQQILWSALHELPAELEERALHWRQSRLEERGFPPWEEALAAYEPPTGNRSRASPPAPADPDGLRAPLSPASLPAVRDRIGSALDLLEGDSRDRVLHELFSLGNRLLVADGGDTGDPSAHRASLEKAAGSIAVALEARRAIDPARAAETLAEVPLLELFREGHARAVALQRRARAMVGSGWAAKHPRALELLDPPIEERVEALLEPRPLYHEVGDGARPAGRRPFRSPDDLRETAVALEIAEVVGRTLVERLGLDLGRALDTERPERAEPPRFSTFLLTLLAWHAARGELRGDPLPGAVVSDFLLNVASRRTADAEAPARALESLIRAARETFDLDDAEKVVFHAFGRACLERLGAECGNLDPNVPVDPRYVPCLLIDPAP